MKSKPTAWKPKMPSPDPGSYVLEFDEFYFNGHGLLTYEEAKKRGLIPSDRGEPSDR